MSRKLQNLVGQRFGRLVVETYAGILPVGKTAASAWHCICDCGDKITVFNNNLKRLNTTSCGCAKLEKIREIRVDLTGRVYHHLSVIRFLRTEMGNSIWECQCRCGTVCEASGSALQSETKKSCGCRQGWWRSPVPGLWKDAAAYAKWKRLNPSKRLRDSVSGSIRVMLKRNGSYKRKKSIRNYLPYSIEELKDHLEKLWEPWMNWENYGGKANDQRKTWHIDHIKPHCLFGYKTMDEDAFRECWNLSNLQPLEKTANMIKGNQY